VVRIAGAPFTFNPTMGNLIVDIVRTQTAAPTTGGAKFLAQTGGYNINRQFNNLNQWGSATDPNWNYPYSRAGDYWDNKSTQAWDENYGLITEFELTPEPGTFVLMGGGLAFAIVAARRRRRVQ
jgi:hypothetical protein